MSRPSSATSSSTIPVAASKRVRTVIARCMSGSASAAFWIRLSATCSSRWKSPRTGGSPGSISSAMVALRIIASVRASMATSRTTASR